MTPLLINPFYQRSELDNLQVNKQFQDENELSKKINDVELYFKLGQSHLFEMTLEDVEKYRKTAHFPKEIIQIDSLKVKLQIEKA